MWVTKSSTPVSSSHRDNGQLGQNNSTTDGGGDFLRALNTQPYMTVEIANGDEGFEARTLAGTGLFLDRHDFHNFVFEFGEEEVDDLILFDGKGEKVNFLHRFDFAIFHKTPEFGDRNPT